MTGVFTEEETRAGHVRHKAKTTNEKPQTNPTHTLNSYFWQPELSEHKLLLFETPKLQCFVQHPQQATTSPH